MEYELPKIIVADKSLKDKEHVEKRALFISLANTFEADFKNNLSLDSLSLSDKYPEVSANEWRKFIQYPPVKRYLDGFLNEIIEKKTMQTLGSSDVGAREAIRIKEGIDNTKTTEDNGKIILMLLPQKDYKI